MFGAQTRGWWRPRLVFSAVFVVLWSPAWLLPSGWPVSSARYFVPLLYLVSWGVGWLVGLRGVASRLLTVDDGTVYVLDCGHKRFSRPKRLMGAVPRAPLESATGRPGWVDLSGERLWVPWGWRRQLRWADWEFYARNSLPG